GRQAASPGEAGRLVREAQEVAADDLPGLTAIHDPLHKHRALGVNKPVVKQLHKHRERFTLQRVLAADQTQDGVRVAKIHQAGDVVPGSARRCQDHDITVAVGADAGLPRHLGRALHGREDALLDHVGLLPAVDHVPHDFLVVEVGDVPRASCLRRSSCLLISSSNRWVCRSTAFNRKSATRPSLEISRTTINVTMVMSIPVMTVVICAVYRGRSPTSESRRRPMLRPTALPTREIEPLSRISSEISKTPSSITPHSVGELESWRVGEAEPAESFHSGLEATNQRAQTGQDPFTFLP